MPGTSKTQAPPMPITLHTVAPDHAWPGTALDWTVAADMAGAVDGLRLVDLLGDGQVLDPARPPELTVTAGGATLFSGVAAPTAVRDGASGVTRIGVDVAGALRGAGLSGTVPDGAAVRVVLHALATTRYATTEPLLSRLLGQGDTLDNGAAASGTQGGAAVSTAPVRAQVVLPASTLSASIFAQDAASVTYRVQLAMPVGIAQGVTIEASVPGLPATLSWDGTAGAVPQPGHAAYGPGNTSAATPVLFGAGPDGTTVRWEFGDIAPMGGAAPAVLDLLVTTPRPVAGPALSATASEANSFGVVSTVRAAAAPAPAFAASPNPAPVLKLQTGILEATGPQSYFAVVGGGTGSPVAYSGFTGQFSGPVTSAAMDADPFSDRLLDVAAGDLVTFVIAAQNVAAGPAWDVTLRNTVPAGFVVPSGGADLHVMNGAGDLLAATGDLFSVTDGLHLDPGAPLAGYDAQSGRNVALVVFTLQATSAIPAPQAVLPSRASVVNAAASSGGANLLAGAPVSASTEVVSAGPALAIALTGTSAAATAGSTLAVGETATFHATVTLPSGRSQGVRIDAAVPAGLAVVSETITYATPGTTGLYVGERSTVGFDLGTVQAGGPVRIELDIVARATGAGAGPVQVVVGASGTGGTQVSAVQGAAVTVLAPDLRLTVDGPAQVQAGQVASYTVRLVNQPGGASAYGVQVSDVLGAGLTLVPGTVQAGGPAGGPAAGATLGMAGGTPGGVGAGTAVLAAGETLTVTFQARAAGSLGTVLGVQARASGASLPGGDPAYVLPVVQAAELATVVGATATLALSSAAPRVGEVVTLRVQAALPAGDNPAVRASIVLPAGLTFVPGSVQVAGGGTPVVSSGVGEVDVALGPVTAPAGGGTVAVTLQAVVGAVPVGSGRGFSAVVDTGYGSSPAAAASLVVADTAPTLAGLPAVVATRDDAAAAPLAGLALTDPDIGQTILVQVQVSNPGDGVLTNLGGGSYDGVAGRYLVSGPVGTVQAALRGLSFVPTPHLVPYGATRTTGVAVQVFDGAGGVAGASVQVAAAGTNTAPTLGGLPAVVSTTDDTSAAPLAGLALTDPDVGQTITAQVQVSNAGDGVLANLGGGSYDRTAGRYVVSGPVGAVQAALQGLSFVPTPHLLPHGAVRTTGLAVQVSDGAGGVASAGVQVAASGANTPPAISGAQGGLSTTATLAVQPLAGIRFSDPDAGQVPTLRVQAPAGLGRLAGGLGSYDAATGTYTAQGTVAALQDDARALVFTPGAAGDAVFAVTLDDGAGGVTQDAGTMLRIQPSADTAGIAQHFLQLPAASFVANVGGQQTTLVGEAYGGPVDYLRAQLIYDSAAPAVIVAHADNTFIKSFSGFCAIQVAGGRNVVDAGPGSNFIVGGTGDDTFFLVGRTDAVTWDTVTGFHPGDMVTLFGFHPGVSTYYWTEVDGAAGYTGRTLHADLAGNGQVTASLTFAGHSAADMASWAVTTGTVGGVDYLAVIGA